MRCVLAPYTRKVEPDGSAAWWPPDGFLAALDVTPTSMQAERFDAVARGYGFFVLPDGAPTSDAHVLLGTGHPSDRGGVHRLAKSAIERITGFIPTGESVAELVYDLLTRGSDPEGLERVCTLEPARGWFEVHLLAEAPVVRRRCDPSGDARQRAEWRKVSDRAKSFLRDLRRRARDGGCRCPLTGKVDVEYHRKALTALMEKYQVGAAALTPNGWQRSETPLPHNTTITDTFNRSNTSSPHTLGTSSDASFTWANINSKEWGIVSNAASAIVVSGQVNSARAEIDLANTDHYAEVASLTGTNNAGGPAIRFSSSAETYYRGIVRTNPDMWVGKVVAGSETILSYTTSGVPTLPLTNVRLDGTGSTITWSHSGGTLRSLTDSSFSNLRVGLSTWTSITVDGFTAVDAGVTNSIAISNPLAYRIYQRDPTSATFNLTGSYSYSGSTGGIEYQVDGGTWSTLVASPSGGTFSGSITLSAGQHTLAVRIANDHSVTASVSNVLVGDVFLVAGQSNAEGRGTNPQSYTHASLKAAMWRQTSTAWANLADPSDSDTLLGSVWPLLATYLLADQSVPVGFITTADGGTTLYGDWKPTPTYGIKLSNAISTVTASGVNKVKAVLWFQGESDAVDGRTGSQYAADLATLLDYFAATLPGGPETIVGVLGPAFTDGIRLAQQTAGNTDADGGNGPRMYDTAGDGLHFISDTDLGTFAKRWWVALKGKYYSGSVTRGPKVTTCTFEDASRDSIIVAFDQVLKTGRTHSANAWAVDDNGTARTVSSVAYHGSNTQALVLTLAAACTGPANTTTVAFGTDGATTTGNTLPVGPDQSLPTTGTVNLPADVFDYTAVAEAFSFEITETTLERGQAGQTLHIAITAGTSTSASDWTLSGTGAAVTGIDATDPANPILTVTAPQATGTATLTYTATGATDTVNVTDTDAPDTPANFTRGTLGYDFTLSWDAVAASPAGETIVYDVRKNGTLVSTGQAGTSYAVTLAADGDVFTVKARDNTGNESTAATYTFTVPGGSVPFVGLSPLVRSA